MNDVDDESSGDSDGDEGHKGPDIEKLIESANITVNFVCRENVGGMTDMREFLSNNEWFYYSCVGPTCIQACVKLNDEQLAFSSPAMGVT